MKETDRNREKQKKTDKTDKNRQRGSNKHLKKGRKPS